MWKNIRGFLYIWTKDDSPGHAAVDGKVDGVGHADECVDEQDDVSRHIVVHKLVHTAHRQILKESLLKNGNKEWKIGRDWMQSSKGGTTFSNVARYSHASSRQRKLVPYTLFHCTRYLSNFLYMRRNPPPHPTLALQRYFKDRYLIKLAHLKSVNSGTMNVIRDEFVPLKKQFFLTLCRFLCPSCRILSRIWMQTGQKFPNPTKSGSTTLLFLYF
jgi:hypothetical protein